MAVKSADQITIVDVTDAYSVMLTSEAYTFVGGTDGVSSGATCSTQAVAYRGTNQCESVTVGTITFDPSDTPITATVNNSGSSVVTITFRTIGTVSDSCEAIIPVGVNDIIVNKKFSFAVAIAGTNGADGMDGTSVTVKSQSVTYAVSDRGTGTPPSSWGGAIPDVGAGQYLWTKTVVTYSDDKSTTSYSVSRNGTNGTNGTNGADGMDAIAMSITSSNGTVFKNSSGDTILTAHVFKGGVEQTITDAGACGTNGSLGNVKWYKSDSYLATSKTWRVTASNVSNVAVYTCKLEVEG